MKLILILACILAVLAVTLAYPVYKNPNGKFFIYLYTNPTCTGTVFSTITARTDTCYLFQNTTSGDVYHSITCGDGQALLNSCTDAACTNCPASNTYTTGICQFLNGYYSIIQCSNSTAVPTLLQEADPATSSVASIHQGVAMFILAIGLMLGIH